MGDSLGIIIQARLTSSRLPGKVLLALEGKPLLRRLCDRVSLSRRIEGLIIATSENASDDPIEQACLSWGVAVFRGAEVDLVVRMLAAAELHGFTAFVRVTADNPLTDYAGIDELIEAYLQTKAEVVHNKHRRGYPYGTGAEVISTGALRRYAALHSEPVARGEEFILWMREDVAHFRSLSVDAPPGLVRPRYFLTVDYQDDLKLMNAIYQRFKGDDAVPLAVVIQYLDENPDLAAINQHLHEEFPY